ncbi:MAG: hypothetical protein LBQ66_13515 [Planctomycetaceae bacterium]|nr:hypothetical protein [Planctomycetaceae bacterium]
MKNKIVVFGYIISLPDFFLGLMVGVWLFFSGYSVYTFLFQKTNEDFTKSLEAVQKLLPPTRETYESYIKDFDHIDRAFAHIDYNGVQELFSTSWKPQKRTRTFPTDLEYKCLQEFELANKCYNEYLTLLSIKYGRNIRMLQLKQSVQNNVSNTD